MLDVGVQGQTQEKTSVFFSQSPSLILLDDCTILQSGVMNSIILKERRAAVRSFADNRKPDGEKSQFDGEILLGRPPPSLPLVVKISIRLNEDE